MNNKIQLMTVALSVALGSFSGAANANFSGPYDISRWAISPEGVDTSGAPSSIDLHVFALAMGESADSVLTIAAVAESDISFNYDTVFQASDFGGYNEFTFLLNGNSTVLVSAVRGDESSSSGSFSQHLHAGDIFGFEICCNGHYPDFFKATVSNFNVTAVPEPTVYAMMLGGLGLIGFMSRRRKDIVIERPEGC